MDYKIDYLILTNSAKLKNLIESKAPYEKVLKQSKKLDKYIIIKMKCINEM